MLGLIWLNGLLARRAPRLAAAAIGVAAAVALLASLGSFLAAAKSTMTVRSVTRVSVDWQVEGSPSIEPALRADHRIVDLRRVDFATTAGLQARTAGQTLTTGAGQVLGLPPGYAAGFPGEIRPLVGDPGGVLLAQQTAANLHASPGDTVTVQRAGLPAASLRVDGVVDLPHADSLFQQVGALPGAQPQAPPDNVLLVPADAWHRLFDPVARARPDQVRTQFHVRLDHALPKDPAAAYTKVTGSARNLEVRLSGAGRIGDNLGAALGAARQDALYAQILFLFLGLPGAVIAGLLTAVVVGSGAVRRRTEQALLRTRGATQRTLVSLAAAEALVVGVAGAVAGLGLAAVTGWLVFGSSRFGTTAATAAYWQGGAALAGLLIAALAVLVPAVRDARRITVATARRQVGAPKRGPAWWRYGLDLWLLVAAGAVFWVLGRGGYTIVLVPEGVPTISVSYWAFAAPALLWAGAGLLAWRLVYALLGRGRPLVARLIRPLAGGLSDAVAATLSRQRGLIARTVALAALTVAFAATTSTFDATYRHQALVDAQLTNGADVTVTQSPGTYVPPDQARQIAAVPGVGHVEPMQHRFAYVGSDLQDLYGIHPATIAGATGLQDAYFSGGTARGLLGRLARRPDSVLISEETMKDFQLHLGDQIRLRLQDGRTKQYRTVTFHFAGIAKEFPTAPKDSFILANADYVAAQTGSDTVGTFLVSAHGRSPHEVAAALRGRLGAQPQITDLDSVRQVIGTSLTAVDLRGLTGIELAYALALAAAATGLLLGLGFTERRRTYALASMLGARGRQLGAFVWTEVAVVAIGALVLGGAAGWALTQMLVKVLTGVFDPPPAALSVPWAYLALVGGLALTTLLIAGRQAIRAVRKPPITVLRDL
jgi:putative ABC transport system permease protein